MSNLPGRCPVCRAWGSAGVCAVCLAVYAAPAPRCMRCAAPTAQPLAQCGQCLADPPPFDATVALADYGFPWDGLLGRMKYGQEPELATTLARALGRAIDGHPAPPAGGGIELVVPVPLSAARLRERGYDQAWELARRLARLRGLPAQARVLARLRDTTHQTALARAERRRNLHDAFAVPALMQPMVAGRTVALVDDVLTTGATASACAQALRAAGAASVHVWVVARTPAPQDR